MPKAKKKAKRQPRKRYSPRQQQVIGQLAEMLGNLMPATSRGPFSLQTLAKERKLGKFFNEKLSSKQKQFTYFITAVHKVHPRTLKPIVNDILADAVARRRSNGKPILRPEADALKTKLLEFGIDLNREIDELELPETRPNITPPPLVVQQALEKLAPHRLLAEKVLPMFKDGYINESIRKAGEMLEVAVMQGSGVCDRYGRDLMSNVFNKDAPIIDVSGTHTSSVLNPMDEKEGFVLIAMGVMQWCKNIVGHGDVDQLAPQDGASRIVLINHLLDVVDAATSRQAPTP
jgi:hypothetical protein